MSNMILIRKYTEGTRRQLRYVLNERVKTLGYKDIFEYALMNTEPTYVNLRHGFKEVYTDHGVPILEAKTIFYDGNVLFRTEKLNPERKESASSKRGSVVRLK